MNGAPDALVRGQRHKCCGLGLFGRRWADEASATPRAGSGEHYSGFKLSNNFHSLSLVTR